MSSRTNQLGKATSSVGTQIGRKGTRPQAEGGSGSTEQGAVPGVGMAPWWESNQMEVGWGGKLKPRAARNPEGSSKSEKSKIQGQS